MSGPVICCRPTPAARSSFPACPTARLLHGPVRGGAGCAPDLSESQALRKGSQKLGLGSPPPAVSCPGLVLPGELLPDYRYLSPPSSCFGWRGLGSSHLGGGVSLALWVAQPGHPSCSQRESWPSSSSFQSAVRAAHPVLCPGPQATPPIWSLPGHMRWGSSRRQAQVPPPPRQEQEAAGRVQPLPPAALAPNSGPRWSSLGQPQAPRASTFPVSVPGG